MGFKCKRNYMKIVAICMFMVLLISTISGPATGSFGVSIATAQPPVPEHNDRYMVSVQCSIQCLDGNNRPFWRTGFRTDCRSKRESSCRTIDEQPCNVRCDPPM